MKKEIIYTHAEVLLMDKISHLDEICENIDEMNSDDGTHYTPSDFIADCKAYVKAVEAGRLMFLEKCTSTSTIYIYTKSYEGTSKKGSYRDYDIMLIILGFDEVRDGIQLPKDCNDAILHKLYKLGLVKYKKYIKLRDRQIHHFTY